MPRVLLIVLDSVGIGHAPDAAAYGDDGADTLGHLLDFDPSLPARLPTLWSLGLGTSCGRDPVPAPAPVSAGCARSLPARTARPATGNSPASSSASRSASSSVPAGARRGDRGRGGRDASSATARPAERKSSTTSAPSTSAPAGRSSTRPPTRVLQIAAHEDVIPVERLYDICRIARRHADPYRIGRVIARPFVGTAGAVHPHRPAARLLDEAAADRAECDRGERPARQVDRQDLRPVRRRGDHRVAPDRQQRGRDAPDGRGLGADRRRAGLHEPGRFRYGLRPPPRPGGVRERPGRSSTAGWPGSSPPAATRTC